MQDAARPGRRPWGLQPALGQGLPRAGSLCRRLRFRTLYNNTSEQGLTHTLGTGLPKDTSPWGRDAGQAGTGAKDKGPRTGWTAGEEVAGTQE